MSDFFGARKLALASMGGNCAFERDCSVELAHQIGDWLEGLGFTRVATTEVLRFVYVNEEKELRFEYSILPDGLLGDAYLISTTGRRLCLQLKTSDWGKVVLSIPTQPHTSHDYPTNPPSITTPTQGENASFAHCLDYHNILVLFISAKRDGDKIMFRNAMLCYDGETITKADISFTVLPSAVEAAEKWGIDTVYPGEGGPLDAIKHLVKEESSLIKDGRVKPSTPLSYFWSFPGATYAREHLTALIYSCYVENLEYVLSQNGNNPFST